LLPGEQKYFLPNSEKFDEINIYIWQICLRNNVSQFVPGFKGYLYKLLEKPLIESLMGGRGE
jgi:hypothetical protein